MRQKTIINTTPVRPPIVAVLGHVDHGKTTLLDAVRKTQIAQVEAGGITQHIGAYQISAKDNRKITFIDTPGHEAFAKIRSRGAQTADIALLVVAANDGVMPQTLESIDLILKAKIPMIVVLNKIDLPEAEPEKVKGQLAKKGVLVEGFGGDVVVVPVSAKNGKGVPQLLEMIHLVSEMQSTQGDINGEFVGIVIEVKRDKFRGILATVIVKNGKLAVGQTIFAENVKAKIRAMHDDLGKSVTETVLSQPVEIMGWESMPQVGAQVSSFKTGKSQKTPQTAPVYEYALPPVVTDKKLKIILKTDTSGSLEAIGENLNKLTEIIYQSPGEINESDILLAKSTGAIIIGFNSLPSPNIAKLAAAEKVKIKTYKIIYELLDEISEVIAILNQPEAQEIFLGKAQILQEFKFEEQKIAGCKILEGRVARGDLVKLIRGGGDPEIGRARIKTTRQGKTDMPKIESGQECGILLDKKLDFKAGDLIIAYRMHELLA